MSGTDFKAADVLGDAQDIELALDVGLQVLFHDRAAEQVKADARHEQVQASLYWH